ncbi:MaoC family dehydratase N-terminal domain-containing protein [Microbispora hainanensis]|jgi:acyl dehydratase|uniref:MaoC family dehydratase N-terminal domain-containing protein n=1 Tax=Microbispora TaxID=2005 RepID=UPI0011C96DAF|nr:MULTISPECIES: MaoC family dehydratase N-terminal domain-containing protein [Microbispora]
MSERTAPGPSPADPREHVGRRFPGGVFTVEPWRAWLVADTVLGEPGGEVAHPLFVWLAATGAMGVTWDELFAWFGATADDGPMFGEHETTVHRPLRVGATYRVSGEITSVDRKSGRSTGPFDVVGYRLRLHDAADGVHVADCWNSIIFPRRG